MMLQQLHYLLYLQGRANDKIYLFHLSCRLLQIENLSHLTLTNITASQQSYMIQVVDSKMY